MSMKKWLAPVLLAPVIIATATATQAADPTGTWQSAGGESRFVVSYCGGTEQLCARLTWLRKDAQTHENLAYLNHNVVTAREAGANRWTGKVIYDGQQFQGSMQMVSANALKLSGCQGIFCKTMTLNRLM